jgi:DNA-binding NarL/FixJ family response regulator
MSFYYLATVQVSTPGESRRAVTGDWQTEAVSMDKPTRVVVAEDHATVRSGIRRMLEKAPDIEVIGEAENGMEALKLVEELTPDVLLLDMEMPVMTGVEVARKLHAQKSPVRILALSAYDDRHYIREMLSSGAAGYLTKDEAPKHIINAVRSIAQGKTGWFSRRISEFLNEG